MKSIFSKLLFFLVLITNLGFSSVVYGMEDSDESPKQQLIQDYKSPSFFTRSLDWLSSYVNGTRKQAEKEVSAEEIEKIQKEFHKMSEEKEEAVKKDDSLRKKKELEEEEEVEGEDDSDFEEEDKTLAQLTKPLPKDVQLLILSFLVQLHKNAEQYVGDTSEMRNGKYEEKLRETMNMIIKKKQRIYPAYGDYLEKIKKNCKKIIEETEQKEKAIFLWKEKWNIHLKQQNLKNLGDISDLWNTMMTDSACTKTKF